ncbi:MAG TPA: hypothetical protein VLF42_03800 [Burkholderiales bacterium]|nr:hypothetical protein [Burkholderiales bacterium]
MRPTVLIALAVLASGPQEAHAYLDPYLGSWLYQLLFPLLLAIAGAWAVLRHKISHFISDFARRLRGE